MTAQSFIHPAGELNESLFPGVDLLASVGVWLEEAEGKTDDENAQRAWVYHRAFRQLADAFHNGVSTAREGEVTGTRSDIQFRYWSNRADREFAKYRNRVGLDVVW